MFNEYDEQALAFLKETGTEMKIRFLKVGKNPNWDDKYERNIYSVTMKNKYGEMKVRFYDSYANYKAHKKPREYDVLACLEKYDVGSFWDFCSEFGYEAKKLRKNDPCKRCPERGYCKGEDTYCDYLKDYKTYQTYKGCVKEYTDLIGMFTEEQMEKLREIN